MRHEVRDERRAGVRHHEANGAQDRCDLAALYPFKRDLSRERGGWPRNLGTLPVPGKFHFPGVGERAAKHGISRPLSKWSLRGSREASDERLLCRMMGALWGSARLKTPSD